MQSNRSTAGPLRLRQLALKERIQLLADDPIDQICAACGVVLLKEEFALAVAVGVHSVDEFEAGDNVEMGVVGDVGEGFVEISVKIFAGDES
jgi:hypothetical protein